MWMIGRLTRCLYSNTPVLSLPGVSACLKSFTSIQHLSGYVHHVVSKYVKGKSGHFTPKCKINNLLVFAPGCSAGGGGFAPCAGTSGKIFPDVELFRSE
jgi:hypothetical protein